jgi:hypothetical protein
MITATPELVQPTVVPVDHRLRVGVSVDSLTLPLWAARVIQAIGTSDFADVAVTIVGSTATSTHKGVNLATRLWRSADESLFGTRCARPDAFRLTASSPYNHPNVIRWIPESASAQLPQHVVNKIRAADLDVIVHLGSEALHPALESLAHYGAWSFADDDQSFSDLFWMMYYKRPVIRDNIQVLRGSQHCSVPGPYLSADAVSFFRNYSNICWKRSDELLSSLAELHRTRFRCIGQHFAKPPGAPQPRPREFDVVRLVPRVLARTVAEEFKKRFMRERWFVAFRKVVNTEEIAGRTSFTVLWPPDGRFYADPFVCERAGKTYIFFEDYSYADSKAVISFVEIDRDGACNQPQVCLQEDFHLAYPSLFSWNGEIFLLPETKNKRTVQLYRATDFPRKWDLAQVLLPDISVADSTLHYHDRKFWLFTSGVGTTDPWFDADRELFVFFAETLDGPWHPHPRNPVVADVRRSRCAGQLFYLGRHLIRPAQDCSSCYGHAVVLNRIEILSTTEYREVPIGRIGPEWMPGNRGTHTFNHSQNYEVLDGRTLISRYRRQNRTPVLQTVSAGTQLLTQF